MAEVDRRSENFAAVALQRAAEAPQSWGLPRELRKASIALLSDIHRKEEEAFLAQMEQEQEQKTGSDSGAASTLAPPTPDPPVTAKQCYAIAETLAKHILARNRNKQPPLEPEPEPEDGEEEMSAEDLALQREQMVQNAADGNLDFADLADASCLPTLLKLMAIPQLT